MAAINDHFIGKSSQNRFVIEKLGTYTYKYSTLVLGIDTIGAIRNKYIYYVTSDYKLMKYDFVEKTEQEIDTKGYMIKTISQDSIGNIILSGYDSSFKEFTGYLDEKDGVTFTPVIDNGGYDVIYMNPIN